MLKIYRSNCIIPDEIEEEIIVLIDFWNQDHINNSLIEIQQKYYIAYCIERAKQTGYPLYFIKQAARIIYLCRFLGAWVNPKPKTIRRYCSLAGLSTKMLHQRWLVLLQGKYWHCTREAVNNMAEYSKQITPQVYRSFFANTLVLSKLSGYQTIAIPMLAICGSTEVEDRKVSLKLLAQNPNCRTITLQGAKHDFPMRNAKQLNPTLKQFILECL